MGLLVCWLLVVLFGLIEGWGVVGWWVGWLVGWWVEKGEDKFTEVPLVNL